MQRGMRRQVRPLDILATLELRKLLLVDVDGTTDVQASHTSRRPSRAL